MCTLYIRHGCGVSGFWLTTYDGTPPGDAREPRQQVRLLPVSRLDLRRILCARVWTTTVINIHGISGLNYTPPGVVGVGLLSVHRVKNILTKIAKV